MRFVRFMALATLGACATEPLSARGGYCHSLADCQVGLVCFEERCSDDLTAIAGDAPPAPAEVVADAGELDAGDAGEADAAIALDAGAASEAGAPAEAGAPDASAPRDATTPVDARTEPDAAREDAAVTPVVDAASQDATTGADASEPDAG